MRPWSAKGTVLINADMKSGALANAESLFTAFTICQGQINFYQINTSPPLISQTLKLESNGLEVTQGKLSSHDVHPERDRIICSLWESMVWIIWAAGFLLDYSESLMSLLRMTSWGLSHANDFSISNIISVSGWKWIEFINLNTVLPLRSIDQYFFFTNQSKHHNFIQLKGLWQYSLPSTHYLTIWEVIYQKQAVRNFFCLLLLQKKFVCARQNLIRVNLDIRFEWGN